MPLLLMIMLFAALGGIASAAFAVVFLWVREEHSSRILPHFVSFATGALLGAALLALLPEAIEGAGPAGAHGIGLALVAGLAVFFVIEKLVLWWTRTRTTGPPAMPAPARSTPTNPPLRATRQDTATSTLVTMPRECWCWWAIACTTRSTGY